MTSRVEELQRMCDNINENGGLDSGEWHTALLAQIAQNLAVIADVMMADHKTKPMETTDYCKICNHKGCETCTADNTNPYCVPSRYETKQTEPQTNADQHVQRVEYVGNAQRCRKCKHIESEHLTPVASDGCCYTYVICTASECKFEPKDEPQTYDDKKHCVFCKWVYEPNVCGRCRNMNLFVDEIEDEQSGKE